VADFDLHDLPDVLLKQARSDLPGVVVQDAGAAVADVLLCTLTAWPRARPWFQTSSLPWRLAMAGHLDDFDSVHYATQGHTAVVTTPVAVTHALRSSHSGDEVIRSYALAVDSMTYIAEIYGQRLRERGFHVSSLLGAVAGAAATVALRPGSTSATVSNAMTVALSTVSGFVGNFGGPLKAFQVAAAARSADEAVGVAGAAALGDTGTTWLEYLEVLAGPDFRTDYVVDAPAGWVLEEWPTKLKESPYCGYFDPIVHAWGGRAVTGAVERIVVACPPVVLAAHRFDEPENPEQAKFSVQSLITDLVERSGGTVERIDVIAAPPGEDGHVLVHQASTVDRLDMVAVPEVVRPDARAVRRKADALGPDPAKSRALATHLLTLAERPVPAWWREAAAMAEIPMDELREVR
jgi:hypothetical protein